MELRIEHVLRVINVAAVVGGREVNIDVAGDLPVLVADHRRTLAQVDARDFAERNLRASRRHQQDSTKRVQVAAIVREIADVDRIALAAFDGGRDIFAAHARADRALNVADSQAVPRGDCAVHVHVDVEPLRHTLGENPSRTRDGTEYLLDLRTYLLNPIDVGALNFKSYRCLDPGQLHVEPVL